MADNLNIVIRAILEKASKQKIIQEIDLIQGHINKTPLKFKIDVNNEEFKKFSANMDSLTKKLNIDFDNLSKKSVSTTFVGGIRKSRTEVEELTNATGDLIRVTNTYAEGKETVTKIDAISNIEKERIAREKLTLQTHKQSLAKKDLLTQIKSMRGKDSAFISEENLVRLDRLERGINKLDPAHKNFTRALNSAKSQLKSINADIGIYKKKVQDASKFTNIWGQSLFDAGKKFAGWMFVATLIMTPVRALREGLSTLKEIDTELINIAKVTEYTNEEMKKLVKTSVSVGVEFGRTAQEYLQSVTEFARAGFGQQAEEYAKLSMLLQNVGDVTAEVANETLIAANAGFQLGGSYESLMGVIDKFNNISNKNATTVTKLSDAMKVGASVFHSAGMTIDETIAIIGTATAATQRSGSEISRAWRTILMNIRQVADEEAEVTEESMKKAESALNSVGIAVRDTPSTFRPMFDIIRDLGNEWENLTQVQQAYVAESLAGKRQANVLIATLQNWSMVEKQLVESINASGSAMQENEIYMQSWEAKAKQLSANMSMFWSNLINTDSVKTFLDFLNNLIVLMDKLVNNSFSGFIVQAGLVSGALYSLYLGIKALNSSGAILSLITLIKTLTTNTAMLSITLGVLTKAMLASPLFWTVAVSAGIVGLTKVIDKLSVSLKEQKEIVANLNSEINSLQSEYDQLKNVDNRTEEQEKYLKILEAQLEAQRKILAIETKRLVNREYLQSEDEKNPGGIFGGRITTNINETIYGKGKPGEINKAISDLKKYNEEIQNINENTKDANKIHDDLKSKIAEKTKFLTEEYNINKNSLRQMKEGNEQNSQEYKALLKVNEAIEKVISKTDDLTDSQKDNNEQTQSQTSTLEQIQSEIEKCASSMELLNKAEKELNEEGYISKKTLDELIEKYDGFIDILGDGEDALTSFINAKKEEKVEFINAEKEKTAELIRQTKIRLQAYERGYEVQQAMLRARFDAGELDRHEYGIMSSAYSMTSDIRRLTKELEELERSSKYLDYVSGNIFKNKDKSSSTSKSTSKSTPLDKIFYNLPEYNEQIKDIVAQLNNLKSEMKSLQNELSIAEALGNTERAIRLQEVLNEKRAIERDLLHETANELRNLQSQISQDFSIAFGLDVTKITETDIKKYFDQIDIKINDLQNKLAKATTDTLKNSLQTQINDLNNNKTLFNTLLNAFRGAESEIEKLGSDWMKSFLDGANYEAEQTAKKRKFNQDLATYLINEEISSLQRLKEETSKTYQLKIDRIQKEIDRLEKRNDLLKEEETRTQKLLELAKQREKLENIKKEKNVRMLINGEWTWVANPRLVREETENLQKLQEDYYKWEEDLRRKKEIDKLRDQITNLQEELRNEEQKYDRQIKNLQDFIAEHQRQQSEFYQLQLKGMNDLIESIKKIENDSYESRLKALKEFVDEYNRISNVKTVSSSTKSSSGSKSSGSSSNSNTSNIINMMKNNSEAWHNASDSGKKALHEQNKVLGKSIGATYDSASGKWKKNGVDLYHDGGEVGKPTNSTEILRKLLNLKSDEVPIIAQQGEFILSRKMINNIIPHITPFKQINTNKPNNTPSPTYQVHIDKVVTEDAASFVNLLPTLVHQYKKL